MHRLLLRGAVYVLPLFWSLFPVRHLALGCWFVDLLTLPDADKSIFRQRVSGGGAEGPGGPGGRSFFSQSFGQITPFVSFFARPLVVAINILALFCFIIFIVIVSPSLYLCTTQPDPHPPQSSLFTIYVDYFYGAVAWWPVRRIKNRKLKPGNMSI